MTQHTPRGPEDLDVLIIGAGLSGIGAAVHLQQQCPDRTVAIWEARHTLGGTWDLFRYPGIRSDSDMHTLGYRFRPWTEAKAIADGPSILRYIADTAREHGIDRLIRYGHRVVHAAWSSAQARWTVRAERPDGSVADVRARVLHLCSGYYDYAQGYRPQWPGEADFTGRFVHPQHWPEDLDVAGQRVLVIGSGATAVTLVPELAQRGAQVTMLQRSPTYIVARPSEDGVANALARVLPARAAYTLTRWKNIVRGIYFYGLARRHPERAKQTLIGWVREALPQADIARDFTPTYAPWDQRICLVPDGDLFRALRKGRAAVATGQIERFTPSGVRLSDGREIAADLVVTATGLQLKVLGGVRFEIDGAPADLRGGLIYKGLMYAGVPNLAFAFGYTNASWTLKCDLTADYLCRVLNLMRARQLDRFVPVLDDPHVEADPGLPLQSGYMQRAADILPRQGSKAPWKLYQNVWRDWWLLNHGRLDDGVLRLGRAGEPLPPSRTLQPRSPAPATAATPLPATSRTLP